MQPRKDEGLKGRDQAQAPKLTQLGRTQLDDVQKVEMAAQALGRAHEHGAMSDVARKFCVSRPTVYAARSAAANVLAEHFDERAATDREPGHQPHEAPTFEGSSSGIGFHLDLLCLRRLRSHALEPLPPACPSYARGRDSREKAQAF